MTVETLILDNLIYDENYFRKALPFVKEEYFEDSGCKILCTQIQEYAEKYNERASIKALQIDVGDRSDLSQEQYKSLQTILDSLCYENHEEHELQWLLDTTEKWCKDRPQS